MHEEISIPELTEVIARLAALFGPREGGVRPLEGGITNRNFLVHFGGDDYVVRLPGKDTNLLGIDREAECLATSKAAELGIGPKVAAMFEDPPCLVTCFVESREMTSRGAARARHAGRGGARAARVPRLGPGAADRLPGLRPRARLRGGGALARGRAARRVRRGARARGRDREAVRGHPEHQPRANHNDLLAANFLDAGDRVVIVDWEYAGMGDPFFDLGNFAVNNELTDADEERLLEAYFGEPATPRRKAALKLFRFMSDFREAMWGVVQTSVSELDFDFPDYADKHFKRLTETGRRPALPHLARGGAWRLAASFRTPLAA